MPRLPDMSRLPIRDKYGCSGRSYARQAGKIRKTSLSVCEEWVVSPLPDDTLHLQVFESHAPVVATLQI